MKEFSWSKSKRVRTRSHYKKIQNDGRKFSTMHFVFFYLKGSQTQIGITITKRIGNAVFRNRMKRFLREYFRVHYHQIPNLHIVVIARYKCMNFCKKEMLDSLGMFFKKIKIKNIKERRRKSQKIIE